MAFNRYNPSNNNRTVNVRNNNATSVISVQPPSLIQRGRRQNITPNMCFGTNSGTLHTELLPDIDASNINYNIYNNLQQQLISVNRRQNVHNNTDNSASNIVIEEKENNNDTVLRDDVQRLKRKVSEIVVLRYNLREKNHASYYTLLHQLYAIYTQQYLKHDEEKETSAAMDQLKQENPNINIDTDMLCTRDGDILIKSNKPLAEITVLGQTLYLLAMYKLEKRDIENAHKYIIRALMYWRCANQCAKRMGATVTPKIDSNTSLLNEIFRINPNNNSNVKYHNVCRSFPQSTNLDIDDLGVFWPQLVQCYIMAGNVFLKHFEYDVSDLMYRTALELCHCMEGRYHHSCMDPLEYLMTQMILTHDIASAIIYCEEMIRIISSESTANMKNDYKLINTKALYSCLLRLSSNNKDKEKGYQLKNQCVKECMDKFGVTAGHTFCIYLYFIKHCIQHGAEYMDEQSIFIEADKMVNYLSNRFSVQRKLKYYEEYHLCQVLQEYLFVISEQAITKYGINAKKNMDMDASYQMQLKHHHVPRLEMLYALHMKHIDGVNSNPLSKQYNRKMLINKRKVQSVYADTFEAYQEVGRANQLRSTFK